MFGEKYGEERFLVYQWNFDVELMSVILPKFVGITSGIRHIEVVAEVAFIEYLKQLYSTLKVKSEEVMIRIKNILEELRVVKNENSALRAKAAIYKASVIVGKILLVEKSEREGYSGGALTPGIVDLEIETDKFIGQIATSYSGGGGGRLNFSQAGGRKPKNLVSALEKVQTELIATLSEKKKKTEFEKMNS
ncbi:hypothetical protein Ahy_A07g033498 [Arachis hypogaea]|uniref:DHHA1 domain-containing protein n=1 Tax=Arachis hypogaea TaxID=3818 RepID=A0A445C9P7_ARAHY|nr:hypothetical protein Ahy_A07g033498 [Arachis hypogaea]